MSVPDLDLDVNGEAPDLQGQTCEAFICEGYAYEGALIIPANVSYLRFDGCWYRLYFDCGIIFWRTQDEAPTPWAIPGEGWSYPQVDVGATAGVVGVRLVEYRMKPTERGSSVSFAFENGWGVILEDADDRTTYAVTYSATQQE